MKDAPSPVRFLLGAVLGCVAFLLTCALSGVIRSPFVIAFAAVVLSSWLWKMSSSIATAIVSCALIEYFIFITHRITLGPTSSHQGVRALTFLFLSLTAATLTRRNVGEKAEQARLAAETQLALARTEQQRALEQLQLRDLARENEVRTELALEGADLGIWEWNVETNISRWSAGFYRLHNLELTREPAYDLWRALVDPDDLPGVEREMQTALDGGRSFATEYRVIRASEAEPERWIAIGGKTVQRNADQPLVIAGYCLDITRRKSTEAALIQTEKLAVAGRLAASIAHEINNPLEAAVNLVYLSQSAEEPERSAFLDETLAQLDRVATIAHQTLRFARRSDGPTICTPSAVVDAVLKLLRPKLEMGHIDLVREIFSEREISCSSGEIQQVITNIINNAIDAIGPSGTLRIRVSDSVRWQGTLLHGVRVTISDTGPGMSRDILRRMKEPFFTTKPDTGTGLGLWVAYELVDRHQGSLLVRTRTEAPNRGTVFSLFLPNTPAPTA